MSQRQGAQQVQRGRKGANTLRKDQGKVLDANNVAPLEDKGKIYRHPLVYLVAHNSALYRYIISITYQAF